MLHLPVKTRDRKTKAKHLLQEGVIPGVVYGPKTDSTSVSIDYKIFFNIYKKAGESTLIALDLGKKMAQKEGESAEKSSEKEDASVKTLAKAENVVLIREVQVHPVTGNFMHVDFYQLPLDKEIELSIPIETSGDAPAVKDYGGILVNNLHEINIRALPTELIHEITVDLGVLENIGDSILVKDLSVPNSIEILADSEEAVFTIEKPREEEPEEEEEEEGTEAEEDAIDAIKTEGEEKREERDAEGVETSSEQKEAETPKTEKVE